MRFGKVNFRKSNFNEYWKHVIDGTENCIEKGGKSEVSLLFKDLSNSLGMFRAS